MTATLMKGKPLADVMDPIDRRDDSALGAADDLVGAFRDAASIDEPSGGMDEGAAGVGRVIRPSAIDHT